MVDGMAPPDRREFDDALAAEPNPGRALDPEQYELRRALGVA